jgi:hypothetical protein
MSFMEAFFKCGGLRVIEEGEVMGGDKFLEFESPGVYIWGAPEVVVGIGVYGQKEVVLAPFGIFDGLG